jgi:hypothetical protein
MKTRIVLNLLCLTFLCLLSAGIASGDVRGRYWDFGIGGGVNLDGNPTNQILLIPAYTAKISGYRLLWYRLEGNLELFEGRREGEHKLTAVVGVAPMLRWHMKETGLSPYVEIGAGGNLVTRNFTINKESGGFFLFSPSAGAGIQFTTHGRPISFSVRLRHLSNAHIFPINESINTLYGILSIGL